MSVPGYPNGCLFIRQSMLIFVLNEHECLAMFLNDPDKIGIFAWVPFDDTEKELFLCPQKKSLGLARRKGNGPTEK